MLEKKYKIRDLYVVKLSRIFDKKYVSYHRFEYSTVPERYIIAKKSKGSQYIPYDAKCYKDVLSNNIYCDSVLCSNNADLLVTEARPLYFYFKEDILEKVPKVTIKQIIELTKGLNKRFEKESGQEK